MYSLLDVLNHHWRQSHTSRSSPQRKAIIVYLWKFMMNNWMKDRFIKWVELCTHLLVWWFSSTAGGRKSPAMEPASFSRQCSSCPLCPCPTSVSVSASVSVSKSCFSISPYRCLPSAECRIRSKRYIINSCQLLELMWLSLSSQQISYRYYQSTESFSMSIIHLQLWYKNAQLSKQEATKTWCS